MLRQPQYEKDPRRFVRIKRIIIIMLISISLLLVYYVKIYKKEQALVGKIDVCGIEQEEVVEMFSDYRYHKTIDINDYFFYGENLNLFINKYRLGQKDEIIGKTLILNNMCQVKEEDEEASELFYLLDEDVDGQLPLEQLEEGLYELFINYDLERLRLTSKESFIDEIETINRRNGKKKIQILSGKDIFDDNVNKNILDKDYLFLNVLDIDNNDQVDLVIDPAYGFNPSGFYNDYGLLFEDTNQAYELYEFSEILIKELRKEGLKVISTKEHKDDIIEVYGESGRIKKGYESKAAYYIYLDWDPYDRPGFKIWHSYYSAPSLARKIGNQLKKRSKFESIQKNGDFMSQLSGKHDADMVIREAGGKALGAGEYSDIAKEGTGPFAYKNNHGMQALTIQLINSQSETELKKWTKQKEAYAKALADSIISALELGEADASTIK